MLLDCNVSCIMCLFFQRERILGTTLELSRMMNFNILQNY